MRFTSRLDIRSHLYAERILRNSKSRQLPIILWHSTSTTTRSTNYCTTLSDYLRSASLEAIRMSKMSNSMKSSMSFADQLKERNARMKRKAEEELGPNTAKRSPPASAPGFGSSDLTSVAKAPSPASRSSTSSSKLTLAYPLGALRITRTPGRRNNKNCVNLEDVIQKQHLISACVFSFFIGQNELYDYLPLSNSSDAVPIYIGRDANMDPLVQEACLETGVTFKDKISNKQLQSVIPKLRQLYKDRYGKNYQAFYAWSPGSSHSKILVLVYPDFLRLVITSCNMMDIDTVFGDNHWFIQDLPKLLPKSTSEPSTFETDLLAHLQTLGTPDAFLKSIQGLYDYSEVNVHLVTSAPGVCSGVKAEKHGLLRLRRIIQDLNLKLLEKDSEDLRLEICAASIGNLSVKWLNSFNDCALGKKELSVAGEDRAVPNVKLFYPSVGDVKKADYSAQDAASNIGCHTRPWNQAPEGIKNIFHHYESKDTGRLFHQKLILAYNPRDESALPYYVYVGSANLSQSAWGALEQDKKKNMATCDTKLVKMSNFECGVVIPGNLVQGLLEAGTESWQSGIVPYVQTGEKYDLRKDQPWNDPRWVQN